MKNDVARSFFEEMGFLIIDNFLSSDELQMIRDYNQFLTRHQLFNPYHFVPTSLYRSDKDLFHDRLLYPAAETLSTITKTKLVPTYSFLINYPPGSELKCHTDQPACVWNLGIIIDQTEPLPFYLYSPAGEKYSFDLEINQAIFYRGTKWPHGREAVPADRTLTSFLMHFEES